MSNIGQAVLTIAGTVIGAYFGNPELGFALGSLAGNVLFPTQLPDGPQITDNRTTTANLGVPCPIVFGTASVAGTVIYLGPLLTSTTEQGSKGGPEQKLYQYNQTIAVGLCESPIDLETAIGGLSRIWENGTLVFDIRPQQTFDTATGQVAETDEQYANRLTASAAYAEGFTLYLGSEDQEVDPTIEGIEGVGNVQPFLGLAYIVYSNRQLQVSQGLRHPNFQFEVFQTGTGECTTTTLLSTDVLHPWVSGGALPGDPTNPANINTWQINFMDTAIQHYDTTWSGVVFDSYDDLIAKISQYGSTTYGTVVGYGISGDGNFPNNGIAGGGGANDEQISSPGVSPDPGSIGLFFSPIAPDAGRFNMGFSDPARVASFAPGNINLTNGQVNLVTGLPITDGRPATIDPYIQTFGPFTESDFWYQSLTCIGVQVNRNPSAPLALCAGLPDATIVGYCVREDGLLLKKNDWAVVSGEYLGLSNANVPHSGDQRIHVQYPLGPVMLASDPNNNESFWTNAYNAAVADGFMPSGFHYLTGGSGQYPVMLTSVYSVDETVCVGGGGQAKVSDIIRSICLRAQVSDIDVTDMESITVDGYPISSLSSAAAAIDPLKSVAFFDSVESGLTIRFQSRGKPIVATLQLDDIGAYDAQNSGAQCPPSVQVVRSLDSDLPVQVRYHYIATSRDYQPGEQDSPFRPTTKAVNPQDVSIPIAIGDTQALQSAEIVWADAWSGRTNYTIAIDQEFAALEGGDSIAIPVDGFFERVRIVKDQNSGMVLRKLTCVSDNAASYVSNAVAAPSQFKPPQIQLVSQTNLFLLDLPALQDADANAGFYTALSRLWGSGNVFKGSQIYRSTDGGANYAAQYAQVSESTYGTLLSAIPASEHYTWDDATIIPVTVADDSLSFESVSDDAVLAGANAAAMGADGRWEIVQFATAVKIAAKTWNLSRLLRGRRGTEHVIGTSAFADLFILLQSGDLNRIALNTSDIGNLDDYKGVSIGAAFNTGIVQPFTGRAVALRPFSPVFIDARYETDGDILITWVRRDKLGRTLMSGVDIPNSESILQFQIDIVDSTPNSPESVIRTITVNNSVQALYTAAQIAADFGSSPPTSLRLDVYQMSAIVGRGTAGRAIIAL